MTATKKSNITSIVLLVVSVLSAVVLFVPALLLAMVSDSCSAESCNMVVFTAGYYIAVFGPGITTVLGLIFTIRAMLQKKDELLSVYFLATQSLMVFSLVKVAH